MRCRTAGAGGLVAALGAWGQCTSTMDAMFFCCILPRHDGCGLLPVARGRPPWRSPLCARGWRGDHSNSPRGEKGRASVACRKKGPPPSVQASHLTSTTTHASPTSTASAQAPLRRSRFTAVQPRRNVRTVHSHGQWIHWTVDPLASGSTGRDRLLIRRQLSASNHSSVCSVPVFVLALLWLVAGGCCSDHGCSLLPPADTRHRAASLSAAVASPPARLLAATPPEPSRRCAGAIPPPPRPPPINTPHTPFSPHHPVPIHGAAH